MKKIQMILVLMAAMLALGAAAPAVVEKDSQIKVYNISDLLWARRDYPFESAITMPPTMPPTRGEVHMSGPRGGGGPGGGGGGGRGGGGGGGGGLFGGAAAVAAAQQETMARQVVDLIIESVDPKSWVQNGGSFTAKFFNESLVINTSKANHEAIAALLGELRAEGTRLVTVKAHWVMPSPQELDAL